jgi:hypothetical protein
MNSVPKRVLPAWVPRAVLPAFIPQQVLKRLRLGSRPLSSSQLAAEEPRGSDTCLSPWGRLTDLSSGCGSWNSPCDLVLSPQPWSMAVLPAQGPTQWPSRSLPADLAATPGCTPSKRPTVYGLWSSLSSQHQPYGSESRQNPCPLESLVIDLSTADPIKDTATTMCPSSSSIHCDHRGNISPKN